MQILDDFERCVDDSVNVFRGMTKENSFVVGAGAAEIQLAKQLNSFADSFVDLEQYAIKKFAEALEVFPRTLAENAGFNATNVLSDLIAAHEKDQNAGVLIEDGGVGDAAKAGVYDLLASKASAIALATDVALTILSIDQIIMSKPAGGPRLPQQGGGMDTEAEFGH